jgi:hypothetical protein
LRNAPVSSMFLRGKMSFSGVRRLKIASRFFLPFFFFSFSFCFCFCFLFFFFLCDRDAFSLIQKTHLIVCQDRLGTNTSQTPASSNKSALVFYIIRTQATTATRRTPCCGAAASLWIPRRRYTAGRALQRGTTTRCGHHKPFLQKPFLFQKTIKQFTKTGSGRRR